MRRFAILSLMLICGIFVFAQSKVKRPDTYNYNRGMEELNNNNYEEALNYFNKEVENDSKNGYAYSWIAVIRNINKEYGKALTASNLAIKNLPKKDNDFVAGTYCIRAEVYLALKDTVSALGDYTYAIKISPEKETPYEKRAQIYYEQKKY